MVDLSNPEAFVWLRQIMVQSVKQHGTAGWMADYGEYLSFDCRLANGMTGEQYHQQYALDWIRLNREAIEAAGIASDCLVFNRCGFGAVNRHAQCFWEGDQNVTWDEHDGLASSIVGLLSGGLSGIAINHSDIGGHTTLVNPLFSMVRTQELLWRWTELAVFQPVMRTHIGTLQTPNHQFYSDSASLVFFGLMTRLHACFSQYFADLEVQCASTGLPVIRHTMIHDQTAMTMDLRYQFMLGSDVVVFPVWESRSRMVRGYIPEGAWMNPWNNRSLDGGRWETFDAPYGKPAFLIRTTSRQGTSLLGNIQAFIKREQVVFDAVANTIPDNGTQTGGNR
jgi:alpha-glucosidase